MSDYNIKKIKDIIYEKEVEILNLCDNDYIECFKEWLIQKQQEKIDLMFNKESFIGKKIQEWKLEEIKELLEDIKNE